MKNDILVNIVMRLYINGEITEAGYEEIMNKIDECKTYSSTKYVQGEPILSEQELLEQKIVWFGGRVCSIKFFCNMQYAYVKYMIENKRVYKAVKKEDKQ